MGSRLPEQGSYCIQGAYLVTMDGEVGDVEDGHLHIDKGKLVAVDNATSCDRPGERLTGRGRVVMPGFVDTHWHLWNVLLRGLVEDGPARNYFAVKDQVAPHYRPIDTYRATRLALAEALRAGFTTVHNWNHNTRSPEDADAGLKAHREVGVRARFSYGHPHEHPDTALLDLDDVLRVRDELARHKDNMLALGMVMRPPNRVGDPKVYKTEWSFARKHGLPMTFHCSGKRTDTWRYANLMAMSEEGLLGSDVQVVHAVHANDQEIRMLAGTGTHISLCPVTQIRSMGAPPLTDLLHQGVTTSLSIDTLAIPTSGDMFLQMRGAYSIEKLRRPDTNIDPRRMLQLATSDGARDLGFDLFTGSLTPGKRADVVVVNTNAVNLAPCSDPISQLVLCAQPDNIECVFVDGRRLVVDGRFQHLDEDAVVEEARDSQEYLLREAKWNWPRWSLAPSRP